MKKIVVDKEGRVVGLSGSFKKKERKKHFKEWDEILGREQ